jgi:hypothetical protein
MAAQPGANGTGFQNDIHNKEQARRCQLQQ